MKNEFENTAISCFEVSCHDPHESSDEVFRAIAKELNANPTIQQFENQIF